MKTNRISPHERVPSNFEILLRKVDIERKDLPKGTKTLVIELEGSILKIKDEKTLENDFEVIVKGRSKFIELRPHALSFLKNLADKFEIIVYSQIED